MADSTGGYNPIKWDCEKQGCWNAACRPPIHFFADCFPRKISMSDIDGVVELNGHFLFFEWKSQDGELPKGQHDAFTRLTMLSKKITFVVVFAPDNPNNVEKMRVIQNGKLRDWEPCSLKDLLRHTKQWAEGVNGKLEAAA